MNKISISPILLIAIIVLAGIFSINASLTYMGTVNACSKCHAMEPFYESYSNPEDFPFLKAHKDEGITCIDCHSPPGREDRDKARTTILKKMVSYVYIGNVTADTSLLKVDCTKCHDLDTTLSDSEIVPHAGVQSCEASCHLAHENIILGDFVERNCADCHTKPDVGGRHANVNCVGCHPTHGRIPSCTGCHASHDGSNVKIENSVCLECHGGSAHTIEVGTYDELSVIPTTICGACHGEQYQKLGNSLHGNMETCVGCHPSHGQIRSCADCHQYTYKMKVQYSAPLHMPAHSELMEGSDGCITCHNVGGGVHKTCTTCHIQDPHTI